MQMTAGWAAWPHPPPHAGWGAPCPAHRPAPPGWGPPCPAHRALTLSLLKGSTGGGVSGQGLTLGGQRARVLIELSGKLGGDAGEGDVRGACVLWG